MRIVAEETKSFIELGLLTLALDADDQPDVVVVGQFTGDDILATLEERLEEGVGEAVVLKATMEFYESAFQNYCMFSGEGNLVYAVYTVV